MSETHDAAERLANALIQIEDMKGSETKPCEGRWWIGLCADEALSFYDSHNKAWTREHAKKFVYAVRARVAELIRNVVKETAIVENVKLTRELESSRSSCAALAARLAAAEKVVEAAKLTPLFSVTKEDGLNLYTCLGCGQKTGGIANLAEPCKEGCRIDLLEAALSAYDAAPPAGEKEQKR